MTDDPTPTTPIAPSLGVIERVDRETAQQVVALAAAHAGSGGVVLVCESRANDVALALRGAGHEVESEEIPGASTIDGRPLVRLQVGAGDTAWIVHADAPRSLAAYQEHIATVGDGDARLLSSAADFSRARANTTADDELGQIDALQGYTEWSGCRLQAMTGALTLTMVAACGRCDNCLNPPAALLGASDARAAVACVIETGERFGVKHLISVLRGEHTDTVGAQGHARIDSWKSGADLSRPQWDAVFRQLLGAGVLRADDGGGLMTTPLSAEVHSGAREIRFTRHIELPEAPMPKRRGVAATRATAGTATSARTPKAAAVRKPTSARAAENAKRELYRWRTAFAAEQGVPAIRVLTDPDISSLIVRRPTTMEQLRRIITPSRCDAYGDAILAALADLK